MTAIDGITAKYVIRDFADFISDDDKVQKLLNVNGSLSVLPGLVTNLRRLSTTQIHT